WRLQSGHNKQGSHGYLDEVTGEALTTRTRTVTDTCFLNYHEDLDLGVSREQARINLPLSTYTEKVWWVNLHNLLHFLSLRMDEHAQLEIREYANVIGEEIVAHLFPI